MTSGEDLTKLFNQGLVPRENAWEFHKKSNRTT